MTGDRRTPRWGTFGGWMPGGPAAVAVQILLLSYLIGSGLDVFDAIFALTHQASAAAIAQRRTPTAALTGYLLLLMLPLLAATLGMRTAMRPMLALSQVDLGLHPTPKTWRRSPAAVLIYIGLLAAAINATTWVLDHCGVHGSGLGAGLHPGPGVLPVEVVHSAIAGLAEEPVLLALLIGLARRTRWPWPVTVAVMIVLRIAFHVYYGWDCLFVVPWMLGAYLLYRWCALLWPFVIAHGAFDTLQALQTYGSQGTARIAQALLSTLSVLGVGLALVIIMPAARRWARRIAIRRDARAAGA